MRPNGRTIYKVLMQNRHQTFSGKRAFVAVRLPLTAIEEPPPSGDFCREWGKELHEGLWCCWHDENNYTKYAIDVEYSMDDPRISLGLSSEKDCVFHELTEHNGHWKWWVGRKTRGRHIPETGEIELVERTNLPAEVVLAHVARVNWSGKYLYGGSGCSPVFAAFWNVRYSTTLAYYVSPRYVYIMYPVKWYIKDTARDFATDLKWAFRVAWKHGVDARLLRRPLGEWR